MGQVLPEHIKEVWEIWNIRGLLVLSLSLQTILILLAPIRRRVSARSLTILLWSCYLLADWSANLTAGMILKKQWRDPKRNDPSQKNNKLMALWSPFLLLHLGGPDTITAFSLEDNALWTRHLLGFVFQVLVCVLCVLQSLPNPLWLPILLLFVAAMIKYLERTIALKCATTSKFTKSGMQTEGLKKQDVEKTFHKMSTTVVIVTRKITEYTARRKTLEGVVKPDRDLSDIDVTHFAFKIFTLVSNLASNFVFGFEDISHIKEFFKALKPEEALMVLEAELCFVYDSLYTKYAVLHTKKGFLFRVIASGSLVWAFCNFHNKDKKRLEFQETDIVITYTLFIAGIALDIVSAFMFYFSNWTIAGIDEDCGMMDFKILRWKKQVSHKRDGFLAASFLQRKWAGKVYAFNFFNLFLKTDGKNVQGTRDSWYQKFRRLYSGGSFIEWIHGVQEYIIDVMTSNKVARYILYPVKAFVQLFSILVGYVNDRLGVKEFIDDIRVESYVSSESLTKSLWSFIFEQLRHKSDFADTDENSNRISLARGEWSLRETHCSRRLIHYTEDVDYDKSLLMWHIATEICYCEEEPSRDNHDVDREFSKTLSDYMMYLMILKPEMMSEVAVLGTLRFRDALAEAEEVLDENIKKSKDVKLAGEKILSLSLDSLLFYKELEDESILQGVSSIVRELKTLEEEGQSKWKILSKVWVELLCFASLHCDATARLELLAKGGELFAFVWLLMAHFGLATYVNTGKSEIIGLFPRISSCPELERAMSYVPSKRFI